MHMKGRLLPMDRLTRPGLTGVMTQTPDPQPQPLSILVLAATGKTGRRIVPRLQTAGHPVRPASRTGAVRFDWADRSSWPGALEGVGAVYLALPLTPVPVRDFVDQAVASGVGRFVALSGRGADTWETGFGQDMIELEQVVRESGVEWSVLRSSNFAQNFDEDVFHEPILAGELALPVGGVPEPFVDVEDVADVAVHLLTEDTHVGEVVEITGPESLSWGEAVAMIAAESGRDISFDDVTAEQFTALLISQGLAPQDAEATELMFAEMRRGLLASPTDGVRDVLGREPQPFAAYVKRAAAAGAWS